MEESRRLESPGRKHPIAGRTLAIRFIVGVVLIPVVLSVTHLGGLVYALFVALLAALGAYEFTAMAQRSGWHPARVLSVVGAAALCLSFHFGRGALPGLVLTALMGLTFLERLARSSKEHYLAGTASTLLGAVYSGWLLGYFIWLRALGADLPGAAEGGLEPGTAFVYLVLIVTWSYDSFAYLAGSLLGKHKLIPKISPSKTVEGMVGGLVGAAAAALVSAATFAPFLGLAEAVALGLGLGVAAQVGDVVESMFKRSAGAKDSSNLIPGHGGFLDRFDSLLFTGPVMYFYVRLIAG